MKHALVIGGTGMLAPVSLWLLDQGYKVSVIGRNPNRLQRLEEKSSPSDFIPISVDYRNIWELEKRVAMSIEKNGMFDLIVAWVRTDAEKALETTIQLNTVPGHTWELIHILGSGRNLSETKKKLPIPDDCIYRQVQLGFKIEGNQSRWLTNEEISSGVIEGILNCDSVKIVGMVEPSEKRPLS
ncbi:short-chain dehydrogenase [Bacillus sp. JJ1122]|uniref:short-chain dehydrogenase n=1 Tax=Bacillus sp. JJ1122 TaxID=3122951 RepID=UPI002FFE8B0C